MDCSLCCPLGNGFAGSGTARLHQLPPSPKLSDCWSHSCPPPSRPMYSHISHNTPSEPFLNSRVYESYIRELKCEISWNMKYTGVLQLFFCGTVNVCHFHCLNSCLQSYLFYLLNQYIFNLQYLNRGLQTMLCIQEHLRVSVLDLDPLGPVGWEVGSFAEGNYHQIAVWELWMNTSDSSLCVFEHFLKNNKLLRDPLLTCWGRSTL